MTGQELYEIHRSTAAELEPIERGLKPLPEWDELPWQMQEKWEQRAVEQGERDMEEVLRERVTL